MTDDGTDHVAEIVPPPATNGSEGSVIQASEISQHQSVESTRIPVI